MPDLTTTLGAPGRVTVNESWSPVWTHRTPRQLRDAKWLALGSVPTSPGAVSLIASLASAVAAAETRRNQRLAVSMSKLTRAVGAIVGGMLTRWGRPDPCAVYRTIAPAGFTGGLVGHRQFVKAMDGLVEAGAVNKTKAVRYTGIDWGDGGAFEGMAARYWPSARLLDLAAKHGVSPLSLPADFHTEYSTVAPKVPELVELVALRPPRRGKTKPKGKVLLPIPPNLAARYEAIRDDVAAANQFAEGFTVNGCIPPRWKRTFTATLGLHGRWYAAGNDDQYQRQRKIRRRAIRISGEPVVEIDIRGSHLMILHGLFGLPAPEGDPYEFEGVSRDVVKAWITGTLGKGSPVTRWADSVVPSVAKQDAREVGAVVLTRYPFLANPSKPLANLVSIGKPQQLLTFALMGIEATALTAAISSLRSKGVLSLPVYDSLIVPAVAEVLAMEEIHLAFHEFEGIDVCLTVDRAAPWKI